MQMRPVPLRALVLILRDLKINFYLILPSYSFLKALTFSVYSVIVRYGISSLCLYWGQVYGYKIYTIFTMIPRNNSPHNP